MDYKALGTQLGKKVFQTKNKVIFINQAEEIIKNLKKRYMNGMYFEITKFAVPKILNEIPYGALLGLRGLESIRTG